MAANQSPFGFGMLATFCTAVLPYPQPGIAPPIMRAVTGVQPTLGLATNPTTRALLPSSGSGRVLLIADVIRRISTSRGTLPDTKIPTTMGRYGIDLLDYVNADMTTSEIGQFSASVDAQIRQDERIINSRTSVVLAGNILIVTINIVDGIGPFRLIVSIDTLTNNLQLLGTS